MKGTDLLEVGEMNASKYNLINSKFLITEIDQNGVVGQRKMIHKPKETTARQRKQLDNMTCQIMFGREENSGEGKTQLTVWCEKSGNFRVDDHFKVNHVDQWQQKRLKQTVILSCKGRSLPQFIVSHL